MIYGMVLKKCQAITWTKVDLLPIGSLQSSFSEIWPVWSKILDNISTAYLHLIHTTFHILL